MTIAQRGLIRIARAIGRWILRRIIARGVDRLIGYMDGKIDDFRRRRARVKAERRHVWLAGRIRRWTTALRWLERRRAEIGEKLVRLVDDEAGKLLPMVANDESYTRWSRRAS